MRRPSPWLVLVVILLGALILREPRMQRLEDVFFAWFVNHSTPVLPPAQVTLIEIGRDDFRRMTPEELKKPLPKGQAARRSLSPLEYALFLQAVMDFQPTVIGLEPIVIWRDRDKAQEQVFIDQAMRVPKLLVGIELGGKGPRDLAAEDVVSFSNVTGSRGNLPQFTGISRQPDDDIRLISTPGFTNLPNERSRRVRVPMLFEYRGEIVPSFPLQAIMLWLRATPADVKIDLGSKIVLPNGWSIPIHRDGTVTINPAARQSVRRLTLNELLLAAQEHDSQQPASIDVDNLKDQIVLLRIAQDPLQPPNVFSTAIATIQNNVYILPAGRTVTWLIVLAAALLSCFLWMIPKSNLVLLAIAFSAGYSLLSLAMLSKNHVWLPTLLPLALMWILVFFRLVIRGPATKHEIAATG
jgi:hypothetical protein